MTRKELQFYLEADMMMNRGIFHYTCKQKIARSFNRDYIIEYLRALRLTEYYSQFPASNIFCRLRYLINKYRVKKLGIRLGFSIAPGVLGYGVVIPHWGTIVVGYPNKIGPYAVLQTSTCISGNGKEIGEGLYMATGAKITSCRFLGDHTTVSANSAVVKNFEESGVLLGGVPAQKIKDRREWWIEDGEEYSLLVSKVENRKKELSII